MRAFKHHIRHLYRSTSSHRLDLVAATIAFWALFSLVPALIALITLYGLVADPADVERQLSAAIAALPPGARELVRSELHELVAASNQSLGLGLLVSTAAAIWSASSGTRALIAGINIAYAEEETRGGVRLRATAIGLTLLVLALCLVYLALIAVIPPLLDQLGLDTGRDLVAIGRWPLLGLLSVAVLSVVYRVGQAARRARWRSLAGGAVVAAALQLVATYLTSFYVSRFGSYQETYGALGGVIVLMMWL